MDRFAAMQVFIRVVDAGGFSRAAEQLGMPKATVTKLIQDLEAHLGAKLLNRTTRSVNVTADGAAYYERAARIMGDLEEAESAIGQAKKTPRGILRIDVPATFGRAVIGPAIGSFHAKYPDIQVHMGCTDRVVDLIEEGIDCVVRGGQLADSTLIARRIGTMHFVTTASVEYLRIHGEPQHPHDLDKHLSVNYFSAKTGRVLPWDFNQDGQRIEMVPPGFFAANDGDAYLSVARQGLGVLQTPWFMIADLVREGTFKVVLKEWAIDPLPVHVLYPQNRHLSAKVRSFVDWVSVLWASNPLLNEPPKY